MKISPALILMLSCTPVLALERGINYDPAHSVEYVKAQTSNNLTGMTQEIKKDLQLIRQNNFTSIKTFYSSVSTVDGKNTALLADLVCPMGFKLELGVYEFDPDSDNCSSWCTAATAIQVQNAIASMKKYPDCITGVLVGNEDIYNWNFTKPKPTMQQRISTDISTIKSAGMPNIPVGTPQQDGALLQLANNDPYGIINKLDYVGVNIYPFWSPQKPNVEQAKKEFLERLKAIQTNPKYQNKKIRVTEEGWPSSSGSGQNPNGSLASEKEYYDWWVQRAATDNFSSYYFGIFDKQPSNSDADKYFGLCTFDRKDKILTQCD